MIRRESVAGSFYPASSEEIEKYFRYFINIYDQHEQLPNIKPRAVIVPHAGYIYSGFTASIAYRLLQKSGLKKFVIIGPSHRVAYRGSSMCPFKSYATPFGALLPEKALFTVLKERFSIPCYLEAHAEHSTEVQFPFIKFFIPDAQIIEIVYSQEDPQNIAKIIKFVLEQKEYGVIISTDLSHFYTLKQANKLDTICLEAVKYLDTNLLHRGCEACGFIGVEAMLIAAKKEDLKPTLLDYRTSADASGDTSRVVGYMSVAFE